MKNDTSSGYYASEEAFLSERKRRRKLNESLFALRAAVPKISKMDKPSIVKDAIDYIQELQEQERKIQAEIVELELLKSNKNTGYDFEQEVLNRFKTSKNDQNHDSEDTTTSSFKVPESRLLRQRTGHSSAYQGGGGCSTLGETEEWLVMFTSLVIEGLSVLFEQLNYALMGMVMAIAGFVICIAEIVYRARTEQVIIEWRGMLPWFYSRFPNYKLFGTTVQYFGLVAAIWQCFHSSLGYFYACQNLQNPIKMSIAMFLLCICMLVSKIINKYSAMNPSRREVL